MQMDIKPCIGYTNLMKLRAVSPLLSKVSPVTIPLLVRLYYYTYLFATIFILIWVGAYLYLGGKSHSSLGIMPLVCVYTIGQFYCVYNMKKGKLWALIISTVIVILFVCTSIEGLISKRVGFSPGDLFVYISAVCLMIIWIKYRSYFK